MDDRLWILGASDPEMERIEALLRERGETYAYAALENGERVRGGEAYSDALTVVAPPSSEAWLGASEGNPASVDVHLVECALPPCQDAATHVRIDHHRPGDPGYGRPPEDFLPASSIGQVIAEMARLGLIPADWEPARSVVEDDFSVASPQWGDIYLSWHPEYGAARQRWVVLGEEMARRTPHDETERPIPRDLVLAAASDHCPGHAYQGRCPGVDPDELLRWRCEMRAAYQGRTPDEIEADVERAVEAVYRSTFVDLLGGRFWTRAGITSRVLPHGHPDAEDSPGTPRPMVRDLRGQHVSELPEASLRLGVPILADGLPDRATGRRKVVLLGDVDGHAVRAFLAVWAESQGLSDTYGDPARGFAGGYIA